MRASSIDVEFSNDLYHKIGTIASEHFETRKEYIKKVVPDSIGEEFELRRPLHYMLVLLK